MTSTGLVRTRPASTYRWVPAAAGWIVGVIATLSLVASISPLIRAVIKVPREFVDDYIFNFPDTSFAWAFVLALLAAALWAGYILLGKRVADAGAGVDSLAVGMAVAALLSAPVLLGAQGARELAEASQRVLPTKLLAAGHPFRHTHVAEALAHQLGRELSTT